MVKVIGIELNFLFFMVFVFFLIGKEMYFYFWVFIVLVYLNISGGRCFIYLVYVFEVCVKVEI